MNPGASFYLANYHDMAQQSENLHVKLKHYSNSKLQHPVSIAC